jgi:hypothetical protein
MPSPVPAQQASAIEPFPADFAVRDIQAYGATIHVRVGGNVRPRAASLANRTAPLT